MDDNKPKAWHPMLPHSPAGRPWEALSAVERAHIMKEHPDWLDTELEAVRWEHIKPSGAPKPMPLDVLEDMDNRDLVDRIEAHAVEARAHERAGDTEAAHSYTKVMLALGAEYLSRRR